MQFMFVGESPIYSKTKQKKNKSSSLSGCWLPFQVEHDIQLTAISQN